MLYFPCEWARYQLSHSARPTAVAGLCLPFPGLSPRCIANENVLVMSSDLLQPFTVNTVLRRIGRPLLVEFFSRFEVASI